MIDIKPKTYNEAVRLKKCYTIANYYSNITENVFNEIYEFLGESDKNSIVASRSILSFVNDAGKVIKTLTVIPKDNSFDGISIDKKSITIVPHYEPSSSSSSGGSSGNNNNNNNS